MPHITESEPTAGRFATRCFVFLVFFHLLPVPWFLVVAAGLAPGVFLFVAGTAGLFVTDSGSLPMATMLLGPATIAGLLFALLSTLLTAVLARLKRSSLRTMGLIAVLAACLGTALIPIYISGTHGGGHSFGFLDFVDVLGQFRIPPTVSIVYFSVLAALLLGLLVYQHNPQRVPTFPLGFTSRRYLLRWSMFGGVVLFVLAFCWAHRVLFFIKPLAEIGFTSAQYHLARALQAHPGSEFRSDTSYHDWLIRAAEKNHMAAAMALGNFLRSAEDRQHWLAVAAEGGLAEAQYRLYLLAMKSDLRTAGPQKSMKWLQSAAEGDLADAQHELGRLLSTGSEILNIAKDLETARKWWERAADNEHGRAMEALALRYTKGADGYPRDPKQGISLMMKVAEGYRLGHYGLPQNRQMAEGIRHQADRIRSLEAMAAHGDGKALATLGRQLIQVSNPGPGVVAEGLALLEKAASQGDGGVQHELGAIFLFGRYGIPKDLERGRRWWQSAVEQKHIKTIEYVAPAYQSRRFGYPADLLKSKVLLELLVVVYRDGLYGVSADQMKERYWLGELNYVDRLIKLAGGNYLPLEDLWQKAETGNLQAQYQLARQLLVAGPQSERHKGRLWLDRAAEGGHAEAQYRLVTYYENQFHIMRDQPARGVALLTAAAEQNHLRAMGALALALEKGRYGLAQNYQEAQIWYQKLLASYESGQYIGEVDERFINFQRRRLNFVSTVNNRAKR